MGLIYFEYTPQFVAGTKRWGYLARISHHLPTAVASANLLHLPQNKSGNKNTSRLAARIFIMSLDKTITGWRQESGHRCR